MENNNEHKYSNIVSRKKKAKTRMAHLRRLQKAYNKLLKRYARLRSMVDA